MSGLRGCLRSMTMQETARYRAFAHRRGISTDFIARMRGMHAGVAPQRFTITRERMKASCCISFSAQPAGGTRLISVIT